MLLVAVSGLALFAVFALINYLVPATGNSDIGAFAGNPLHGRAGGLLPARSTPTSGSLSVNAYSPVSPARGHRSSGCAAAAGLVPAPACCRGPTPPSRCCAITLAMMWLVPVLGWFADDSGIIVPATALPLALPLGIAMLAGVPLSDDADDGSGSAVTGSAVTGRIG